MFTFPISRKFSSNFNLNRSFALRQMQISIELIYPFSIMHSLVYGLQMYVLPFFYNSVYNGSLEMDMFLFEMLNLVSF